MKYALCMSGEMRTYRHTNNSIKHILPDAHIYLHTWKTSTDSWKNAHLDLPITKENISKEDIFTQYGELVKQCVVESFFDIKDYYTGIECNGYTAKLPSNVPEKRKIYIDTLYSMYKSFCLYDESSEEYDIVVNIRPDVLLLKKPELYYGPGIYQSRCPGYNQEFKLNNFFAWGDPLSMEIYYSMFEYCTDIYKKYINERGQLKGQEVMLQNYVNETGVPVYDVDLHGQLLRSKDVVETHQIDYYKPL